MDEEIESGLPVPTEETREEDLTDRSVLSMSLPLVRSEICRDGEDESASQNKDSNRDVVERESDKERNKNESVTALEICKK